MRQVKEVLRQKWVLGRSHRKIARSVGIGAGSVGDTLVRAKHVGLTDWAVIAELSEEALEQRLYGPKGPAATARPLPDAATLDIELRRKGVTLQLLHVEYLEVHPDGYRYTQFCQHYKDWKKRQGPTMRQVHGAGEKMFVDYSGDRPHFVDPVTGEVIWVELFVAVLGASNYTFAEATMTQGTRDWIRSHEHAFEYFSGVAEAVVPDQLKSGVTEPCRYEPGVQRTYEEMCCHYGTAPLPARQRKPRDKAKVEAGVLVAQRWVLARVRNQTFYSLSELNARIRELLDELNGRKMRRYGTTRRELFERLDKPALRRLPGTRFVYGEWHINKKPGIDYHLDVEGHYYSVPHDMRDERFDARVSTGVVEILASGQASRVTPTKPQEGAAHYGPGTHASVSPGACRMVPLSSDTMGNQGGPRNGDACCRDYSRPTTPGTRLSIMPRNHALGQAVRQRAARIRLCASRACEGAVVQARGSDSEERHRSFAAP